MEPVCRAAAAGRGRGAGRTVGGAACALPPPRYGMVRPAARSGAARADRARPWPPGVSLLAFLAGVMRSVCDEQWRRHRRQDRLPILQGSGGADDPERACAAAEALAAILRLFASDKAALKVITGLISGMAADHIRRHYGLTAEEYDTTRRRIRQTLLRHGLTWSWP